MKKLLVMISMAALVSFALTSTAMALTTITTTAVTLGSTPFKASTGVTLLADGDLGGYNCASKHVSGDRGYVSSSISSSIIEGTAAKGAVIAAIPTVGVPVAEIYTSSMGGY